MAGSGIGFSPLINLKRGRGAAHRIRTISFLVGGRYARDPHREQNISEKDKSMLV
jgi:hypothetical protein